MNQTAASATTESTATTASSQVPQPGDPRYDFAVVTSAVGDLIAAVEPDQIDNATPCPDFRVKELLEHLVLAMRRVAGIGQGLAFYAIVEEPVDDRWHDQYRQAAHDVMETWSDASKLDGTYEVPWGVITGAPFFGAYTGELAVHGWDLAQATGQELTIPDAVLEASLAGAKSDIPAEIRADEMVPFGVPVEPGPDASTLLRLAGWYGRNVLG